MQMIRINSFLRLVFFCSVILSSAVARADDFSVPKGLEGRVEFWKLIFSSYGKDQRVFHYRLYPEIIYSVLDFSDYEAKLSGPALEQRKRQAVDREINNIRIALLNLASGAPARSVLEKRIKRLFKIVPGGIEKYRLATTDEQIRYQTGVMERFRDGLVRSGRYLPIIKKIFSAEGLPEEIGRLPLVESSFDYEAYSSVGAAGIWQFMRATGRLYMMVNSAIDERRDPVIASRAAAKYLKNAYSQLGEWPLALTSYNHGLGGVKRAVSETGTTHLPTIIKNYKSSSFGFASSNFYAEFLAALDIEQNSDQYFKGLIREKPWSFEEVSLGRAITYPELLRLEGGDSSRLQQLNLAFRSPILSGKAKIPAGTLVKVPAGRGANLVAAISGSGLHQIADGLVDPPKMIGYNIPPSTTIVASGFSYKVKNGDTLSSIASSNRVSLAQLMSANNLNKKSKLKIGQSLKVTGGASKKISALNTVTKAPVAKSNYRVHVVAKGDSLFSISRKYKVSLGNLTTFNGLGAKSSIKAGQRLKIP